MQIKQCQVYDKVRVTFILICVFFGHVGPKGFCKFLVGWKYFKKKYHHVSSPTIAFLWTKYEKIDFWSCAIHLRFGSVLVDIRFELLLLVNICVRYP